MKKQFDDSFYDASLERLDSEIIWDKERNEQLYQKIIADMNKVSIRAKVQKILMYSSTVVALLAVIIFSYNIVVNSNKDFQYLHNNNESKLLGAAENQDTAYDKLEIADHVTISGKTSFILSEEAAIPVDLTKIIPEITDLGSISHSTGLSDVKVVFPYESNGNSLMIKMIPNMYNIDEVIQEKLNYDKSDTKELVISGKRAVLWENPKGLSPQLFVVTKHYIYSVEYAFIHQPNSKLKPLIELAKQIQFQR